MDSESPKSPYSLSTFIELVARQLRNVVKSASLKGRTIKEENGLSNTNKIKRIALLLRSEVKKIRPPRKKQR